MRKLVASTSVSLDGVMQAPGGPEEDPTAAFAFGGWAFPYWDETLDLTDRGFEGQDREIVLGRKTYEIFAGFWPNLPADNPNAQSMNAAKKYVASRTLKTLEWANSVLLAGDVVEAVAALKAQPGNDLPDCRLWQPDSVAAGCVTDRRIHRVDVPRHPRARQAAVRDDGEAGGSAPHRYVGLGHRCCYEQLRTGRRHPARFTRTGRAQRGVIRSAGQHCSWGSPTWRVCRCAPTRRFAHAAEVEAGRSDVAAGRVDVAAGRADAAAGRADAAAERSRHQRQ
jgi:dihydrofolate reductase